jgi:hypothetical protein
MEEGNVSDNHQASSHYDPVVQPFVDLWSSAIERSNNATRELLQDLNDGAGSKAWQRKWFDAVSKSMDAYMRSPMFLQAMKQNTETVIKVKRQADDIAAEIARNANIPTATDISGLFERLHSVEEVILARLGRIEERLRAIEQQARAGQEVGG